MQSLRNYKERKGSRVSFGGTEQSLEKGKIESENIPGINGEVFKIELKKEYFTSMFFNKKSNPYLILKNYTLKNIKYWLQGKWRKFIIRQYNKLDLPNDALANRIVKYSSYLGSCPSCKCPMSEILLTNKECTT